MFVHNLDPVIFSLGPIAIRWYGLVYVLGFLGLYWALRRIQGLSAKKADSLLLWLIVGMVLGARSFFFAFYRPELFSIGEFFAVWNGGMSFHGALLGLGVSLVLWCKRYGEDAWAIADVGALIAGWFLALGRVTNFINAEIVGRPFDGSWCVLFPGYEQCRHPVQVYAAVKDVVLGSLLLLTYRSGKYASGFLFWVFCFVYGILRFIVQFWRTEPLVYGLQMGHWLSITLLVIATYFLLNKHRTDLAKLFKRSSAE